MLITSWSCCDGPSKWQEKENEEKQRQKIKGGNN